MYLQRKMQKESAENSTVIMCMLVLWHLYAVSGTCTTALASMKFLQKKWGNRKQYINTHIQVCMEEKNDTVIWVLHGTYMYVMHDKLEL